MIGEPFLKGLVMIFIYVFCLSKENEKIKPLVWLTLFGILITRLGSLIGTLLLLILFATLVRNYKYDGHVVVFILLIIYGYFLFTPLEARASTHSQYSQEEIVSIDQWEISYYSSENNYLSDHPSYRSTLDEIDLNWGVTSPDLLPSDNFVVVMQTRVDAHRKSWTLCVESDKSIRILTNGSVIFDNWDTNQSPNQCFHLYGDLDIQIEYIDQYAEAWARAWIEK